MPRGVSLSADLDSFPGVLWLNHMVVLFLAFEGISTLIYIMTVLIYIPNNSM